MKISIIIPYHGEEMFLHDCLDSLRDQEFQDFEVIIVSDHCKGVHKVTDSYQKNLTIKTEELSGGTGVAAARNRGMDLAGGEYIYFLDCDDYLYRGALKLLVEALEEDTEMVYGRRATSWFRRSVFVPILDERIAAREQEKLENGEVEEDDEESESASEDDEASKEVDSEEVIAQKVERSVYDLPIKADPGSPSQRCAIVHLFQNRIGLKNISVLSILLKRDFLLKYQIRFMESFLYYSDLPFMTKVLQNGRNFVNCNDSIYIKRRHNDPIHEPSLSQVSDEGKFEEYIKGFETAFQLVPRKSLLDYVIVRKIINYYSNYFSIKLRRGDSEVFMGERFDRMKALFQKLDTCHFKPLRGYKKRSVKALVKKDAEACLKVTNRHLAAKKALRFLKKKGELSRYLYKYYFSNMSLKNNYVVIESFFGKSYSDSPKYIYEYLMKHYKEKGYQCIWSYSDKKFKLPYGGKCVKRFGIRYTYYMARSKYFVFNVRQPYWYVKREGQVFLETWHGTPLKKLFFDMDEVYSASRLSKKQVYNQSKEWDYLIAPNYFSSKVFRSCFAFENEMLETGYPRNDIMHAPNREEKAKEVRRKLGIPADKKTVLYAPTWRDDEYYGKGKYKFTLKLDLERMKQELGNQYVILLRTHYYIADQLDVTGVEDFAYNVSKYNDISELYLISDVLITDYSSVFFDYANLRRPMLFFTYDLEKYRDILRGFYIDIEEELPGPLLYTNDDVLDAFGHLDEIVEQNQEKYKRFYEKYCGLEDGHASENVVKRTFGL